MTINTQFLSYLAQFFLEWKMFQTKVVEKIKTQILCSVNFFFFRKSCRLWDNVEKYGRAGQATDDNSQGVTRTTPLHLVPSKTPHHPYS